MTGIVEIAGAVIILAAVAQALLGIYSISLRAATHRRQSAEQLEVFKERTRILLERAAVERDRTELSWNGKRKFEVRRREYENQKEDICSFYLVPHDKRSIPPFKPGQFLTFELPVPGQPQPVVRCYSLSDSAVEADHYRVSIKKLGVPPNAPEGTLPGISSNYFHDHLKEGEIVEVMAPAGEFYLNEEADRPVVLIGGGVGITPVFSMLKTLAQRQSNREVLFFYGTINRSEHAMYEAMKEIDREHANIRVIVCYSNPAEGDVEGRDYDHKGYVGVDLIKTYVESNNYEFYTCGPPPMMEMVTQHLEEWGVPEEDINYEAFGPATVKKTQDTDDTADDGEAIELVFARSNRTLQWTPSSGTLLEFGEANGIKMNCGCRSGSCGTCLTALKEGDVEYIHRPGKKPEPGSCLTCISQPKGRLVLDA